MYGFIEQENVYKLDSWPLQKKYHPISTNPKIGVRGGKLLRTHGKGAILQILTRTSDSWESNRNFRSRFFEKLDGSQSVGIDFDSRLLTVRFSKLSRLPNIDF